MKNILAILILTTINFSVDAQSNQVTYKQKPDRDAASSHIAYRLYPTENMWTFIKLNTRNGKMWQVQYDVEGNNRFEVFLSLESLIDVGKEANDRFMLYPTKNIYNFILVDQLDGRVWQVQWSLEAENRGVVPIL
jgi:hypothetical protein